MLLTKLRGYQEEAIARARPHAGFAFFSEQRTGKNLPTLALIDERKPDVLFILTTKKGVGEWNRQIRKHLKFDWKCQKLILHYHAASRSKKDRAWYRKQFRRWQDEGLTVFSVIDEGHKIKRRGSYFSRFVRSIGPYSDYRLLLGGTPIAQGIHDAWAQFDYIQRGVLGKKYEWFQKRYVIREKQVFGHGDRRKEFLKIVGYKNTKEFYRIFHRYSYRLTLREAQRAEGKRPYKVRTRVIPVELNPDSRRAYTELEERLVTEVRKRRISTPMVMTLTFKLQQIAGGYLIHTEPLYYRNGIPKLTPSGKPRVKRTIIPVGKEKMVRFRKLIQTPFFAKRKFVVCVKYTHETERVGRTLTKLGKTWKVIAGGHHFDGTFDTDAAILQIQSGEAIDLAAADTYVFYSWDHSYINHEQSRFRILSFDSSQVNYFFLVAVDTIDVEIYEAVRRKKDLATLVCDKYRRRRRHGKANVHHKVAPRAQKALAAAA